MQMGIRTTESLRALRRLTACAATGVWEAAQMGVRCEVTGTSDDPCETQAQGLRDPSGRPRGIMQVPVTLS